MITLRDYQQQCCDILFESTRRDNLVVLPCSSGKTEIFIEHLSRTRNLKTLIVLNKVGLLDQTVRRVAEALRGIPVRIFCGSREKARDEGQRLTIATVQSILKSDANHFDQIVLDEIHSLDIENENQRYAQLLKRFDKAKVLGFTATPFRSNGFIYGPGKFFKSIIFELSIKELIGRGYIVPPTLRGSAFSHDISKLSIRMGEYDQGQVEALCMDMEKLNAQVRDALSRSLDRKKIVWFCASIKHAEAVRDILNSHNEDAAIIHSKLNDEARELQMYRFEQTLARHLAFVTIVAEGYDYHAIDCIVMLRPTRSPTLYIQVVGRALRLSEGKSEARILDYGRVVENIGPLDAPRINTGSGKGKKKEVALAPPMRQCPGCFLLIPMAAVNCPECDYLFERALQLTRKPEENLPILSDKEMARGVTEGIVLSAVFQKHISQAGRQCIKAAFTMGSKKRLIQYFVVENEQRSWNVPKLRRLGFEYGKSPLPSIIYFNENTRLVYLDKGPFIESIRIEDGAEIGAGEEYRA